MINDLVPRDHCRRPVVEASHLKGLMKAEFHAMSAHLGWDQSVETRIFGGHGLPADAARIGLQAAFHLTDAVAEDSPHTVLVTRTAVEESGVAKDASLRTTEAIPVGTTFKGELHTDAVDGSLEDLAWRLSLTAIRDWRQQEPRVRSLSCRDQE